MKFMLRLSLVFLAAGVLLPPARAFAQAKKKAEARGRRGLYIPEVTRDQVICFALYTVHRNILKLTAQLYPLKEGEDRTVRLEIKEGGRWKQIAEVEVIEQGWTAPFRVENWDSTRDTEYRVAHGETAHYTGKIRKDPADKETIVVAAFTGNSNADRGPRPDIIRNVKAHDVDLLFFSGDQVYDHGQHYASWLNFGRQFHEIIRDRPAITIPDDHDVGQGNLWGAGGKKASTGAGDDGGYFYPPEFVKEVERAQASHLPDPYDPRPIGQGIGVYFTALNWGGISFAVIEDRKFKTGPKGLIPQQGPRPDHVNDSSYDPKSLDVAGAELLGERQLKFLEEWAADWSGGAELKAVLSQTVFANAAHIHGRSNSRLLADLDSNGWPQTGRNKAISQIRKAFAIHICGDQHLATVIHHGIDDWNDACFSFSAPSIVNYYNRWWWPLMPGKNRQPGPLEMTGEFLDGLGNKINMLAYANPAPGNNRAAGHGIIRFHKKTRKITIECWPRFSDVTDPNAKQFPGWPITIDQEDNYGKKAAAYLPAIQVSGMENPVVQVVDESNGEVVYTLRIQGNSYRPRVFQKGKYTIHVGEGSRRKTFRGIESIGLKGEKTLEVRF